MSTYFGRVGNFGEINDEDLFGKKIWIFEIPCEGQILLSLGKNPRSSFAVRKTSLKHLINTKLDSYSSLSEDIVGEAYALMVFHSFSTKKFDIMWSFFACN